jgi:Cu+-exporting ATPase
MTNNLIELKVDGMDCNSCAASITKFLERKGMEDVYVNYATKEVRFRPGSEVQPMEKILAGIQKMGYHVIDEKTGEPWWTLERKLLISAIFTLPLLLYHFLMMGGLHIHWMENGWVQLALCLPAFVIGFLHFGRSAWGSLREGAPNMDVLIFIGSTAAFIYSVMGLALANPDLYFFETSATIITLVLVGNWMEKRAVQQTTTAIGELTKLQAEKARQVMPSGTVVTISKEDIQPGITLQVNEGDKIPADGRIISGEATIDESMLTGESIPVEKQAGDELIGASIVVSGNLRMEVTAAGKDTVLSQMIELVKTAQQDKPKIQRLADRISAIFVPVVVGIALLTFLIGHFGFNLSFQQALMNSIAVLVISCPCAMGLATPTAVMVGVGRLAKNGILIRGGQTIELFTQIKNIVFDKTGTLTTGDFKIKEIKYQSPDEARVNALIYKLEQHSSHPIARSLVHAMQERVNGVDLSDLRVEEKKGVGVFATDGKGNTYAIKAGRKEGDRAMNKLIALSQNDQPLATIEISDELKPNAKKLIQLLQAQGMEPVILSGDHHSKTEEIAAELGVKTFHAGKMPAEKLAIIEELAGRQPTAMVGDGINDAPALAKATLGISLSNASQVAIQSAQIVLLNGQLDKLGKALTISRKTVTTIKQNLFWAFIYNVVAIPIAAVGLLNPMWGALFMAFSDIVVIGNSVRLKYKKI